MKLTVLRIDTVTTTVNCCMCFEYDVMKRKSYSHFILLVPPFWQISRLDHQNVFLYFSDKETKRLPSNFRWKYLPFNAWGK